MIGDILQPTHLLFVLVIALLVLGPKRLPEVGKSLGRGLRDFRNALSGDDHDDERPLPSPTQYTPAEPAAQPQPQPGHQPATEPQPVAQEPQDELSRQIRDFSRPDEATDEPAAGSAQHTAS